MNKLAFGLIIAVAVMLCEGRIRRQVGWEPPRRQFWPQASPINGDRLDDFYGPMDNSWRNDENDYSNSQFDFEPKGGRRRDSRPNNSWSRNQDRVTSSIPATSTLRTIHSSPQDCSCSATPQFNPVCGTDGNTYRNVGLLNCYRQCGIDVSQKRMGSC